MPILSNMQEAVDQDGTPNSNIGGKVDRLSGTLENIAQNLGAVDDIINLAWIPLSILIYCPQVLSNIL